MSGRRTLHFVFKIGDRTKSIEFFRKILGMKVRIYITLILLRHSSNQCKNTDKVDNTIIGIIHVNAH